MASTRKLTAKRDVPAEDADPDSAPPDDSSRSSRMRKEWVVLFAGLALVTFCGYLILHIPPADQKIVLAVLSVGASFVLAGMGLKSNVIDSLGKIMSKRP